MAGGGFAAAEGGHARDDYGGGGVTVSVVATCLMAASCGLIFGYDIGVSGGVTQMESFLVKFFPEVSSGTKNAKHDAYCKYDDQRITAFTSSLYFAAMLSSLVASRVTRTVGRSAVMLIGGVLFLVGSAINAGAVNIAMLIIGRMLLGFGVLFTRLLLCTSRRHRRHGGAGRSPRRTASSRCWAHWPPRSPTTSPTASRAGAGACRGASPPSRPPSSSWAPCSSRTLPASLVLRGDTDRARVLGAETDAELKDIVLAVEDARRNDEGAYGSLCAKGYGHYLVMVVAIPSFFDLTGVIVMAVFSPVLFRTVGFSSQKAIFGSVILSLVNLASSLLSSFVMDRAGRRFLFLAGGAAMMICQLAMSFILAGHLGKHNAATMPLDYAEAMLVLMCLYTFSFGVSWGPLKWVVPSEIYPVEIRSAAQALTVSIALCLSFAQTQVFVSLLCAMRHAIFLFYAGWVLAMTAFVAAFLPETKGVPLELEAMRSVWAGHWYWRRFVRDAKQEVQVNCL